MSDIESEPELCVSLTYGQVYKIQGNGRVYIGSTKKRALQRRLGLHRRDWEVYTDDSNSEGHYVSSFECFGGPEPPTISMLEELMFTHVVELRMREQAHIDNTPECVNKQRAHSSEERRMHLRRLQSQRNYYRRDPAQQAAYAAKVTICECSKSYTRAGAFAHRMTKYHMDHIAQHGYQTESKQNRLSLEQLQAKKDRLKEKVECGCGSTVARSGLPGHRKSKAHLAFVSSQESTPES